MLGLPGAQLPGAERGGERAARLGVGDQHGLVRGKDGGGFGHEVNAAEHDRLCVGRGGLAGEPERVAHVVGDVLDLGALVVVGEDDGVSFAGERPDLFLQRCEPLGGHCTSRETRSERAEWVSAPTETKSTPVSA